jgi:hypothetical protein
VNGITYVIAIPLVVAGLVWFVVAMIAVVVTVIFGPVMAERLFSTFLPLGANEKLLRELFAFIPAFWPFLPVLPLIVLGIFMAIYEDVKLEFKSRSQRRFMRSR